MKPLSKPRWVPVSYCINVDYFLDRYHPKKTINVHRCLYHSGDIVNDMLFRGNYNWKTFDYPSSKVSEKTLKKGIEKTKKMVKAELNRRGMTKANANIIFNRLFGEEIY